MTQTSDSTEGAKSGRPAEAGAGHGEAGHGHGDAHLAHHFDTPRQQMETGKLGMWVFLATEILMFGGLFCAYAVYRANNPAIFDYGHHFLDTTWGAINTVILIASSFTMAWAVRAAQLGQKRLLVWLLALTLLGGTGFMVIKGIEYNGKFQSNLVPGQSNVFYPASLNPRFSLPIEGEPEGATPRSRQLAEIAYLESKYFGDDRQEGEIRYADLSPLDQDRMHTFFQVYYLMTGLHGIHVLIGMGLIGYLVLRASQGVFSGRYFAPVDLIGLYWHLVDLIWIFLFPLLYLIH